jgi:CheY-like chemotaxis protein
MEGDRHAGLTDAVRGRRYCTNGTPPVEAAADSSATFSYPAGQIALRVACCVSEEVVYSQLGAFIFARAPADSAGGAHTAYKLPAREAWECHMAPVLVVDDDNAVRNMIRLVLEDDGYTVLEASDGAAALALLRASYQPLVVLLDLAMPGTPGEAVLRAVQAEPELRRHIYVVITVSAASQFTPVVRSLVAAVCLEAVQKPFTINRLVEVVRRAERQIAPQAEGYLAG